LPVIVTGKPKISTSRRQVLPDIDLGQTRFRINWSVDLQMVVSHVCRDVMLTHIISSVFIKEEFELKFV